MDCEKYDALTLLSYITGDLSRKGGSEVAGHLEQCEACAAFVAQAREQQCQFLKEFPEVPEVTVMKKTPVSILYSRHVLALAASLLIVLGGTAILMRHSQSGIRTKGTVGLGVYVLDETGQAVKRNDNIYHPGERMQFTYTSGDKNYLILLSCDTSGAVTRYYPIEGDSSAQVNAGADIPLPHSIELDDYVGDELYIAVFSRQPIGLKPVVGIVRKEAVKTPRLHDMSFTIKGAVVKLVPIVKRRKK